MRYDDNPRPRAAYRPRGRISHPPNLGPPPVTTASPGLHQDRRIRRAPRFPPPIPPDFDFEHPPLPGQRPWARPYRRMAKPGLAFGQTSAPGNVNRAVMYASSALSLASAGASAYHGYKRNDSVGWAVAWGLLGGIFPVITPAIALAQGFGKRKVGR